jgi:GrpB-like predicted nucleotidyltransferase (UPF0157 family)
VSRQIVVVDYDPDWPRTFETLRRRIWPAIAGVAESIEHVGSTAVPGLAAKPIIDMTIVVPPLPSGEAMATVISRLAAAGYRHQGDWGISGREAFTTAENSPAHHLYACVRGNLGLRNHLAIRDHLRKHPDKARQYGELKKQLAAAHHHDIDAYIEGKTDFLISILRQSDLTADDLAAIVAINRKP